MADYVIKANISEIRNTTDKIETQRSVMETCMNDMKSKFTELQTYFDSEAGREYDIKCTNLYNDLNACLVNLSKEITSLRTAAGILESGNANAAADVNAITASKVFVNI